MPNHDTPLTLLWSSPRLTTREHVGQGALPRLRLLTCSGMPAWAIASTWSKDYRLLMLQDLIPSRSSRD